jgi:hypothetical protein
MHVLSVGMRYKTYALSIAKKRTLMQKKIYKTLKQYFSKAYSSRLRLFSSKRFNYSSNTYKFVI